MPRRKQARHTGVKDIRSILRLTFEQELPIRAVLERLKISKTSVRRTTYLLRAREAGLAVWPLPPGLDDDEVLERRLFRRMGRPPRDIDEPDWPKIGSELKRKGVTLNLLWQEYREAHPDGYGYTWFCCRFAEYECRVKPTYRSRHVAGVAMECDYAGHTIPIIEPSAGEIRAAQIYVAVLSASQLTFSYASFSQKLPDWIEANQRAFSYFGGVTKTTICDNLKSAVAKALWFEPTLNATFAAFAEHYDTTILPARPKRPRDKPSAEGSVLIVERWVLARLRNERFFSLADLNIQISALIEDLNGRTMRRYGKSRHALFDEVERAQLKPLPATPFEYAEWKVAKVHPDYSPQRFVLGAGGMAERKRELDSDWPNRHRKDMDCLRLWTTGGPPRLFRALRSHATALRGSRTGTARRALSAPHRQACSCAIAGARRLGNTYPERSAAPRSAGNLRGAIPAEIDADHGSTSRGRLA